MILEIKYQYIPAKPGTYPINVAIVARWFLLTFATCVTENWANKILHKNGWQLWPILVFPQKYMTENIIFDKNTYTQYLYKPWSGERVYQIPQTYLWQMSCD